MRFTNISNVVAQNAALLSGRIEATGVHVALPEAAALVTSGQVKVIGRSPTDGIYVNAAGRVAYFAMREFADKHPEAIRAFLKTRQRTDAWVKTHLDEAAAIIARDTRVPVDIAKFEIADASSFELIEGEPSRDVAVNSVKAFQQWYIAHDDDILAKSHLSDAAIEAFIDGRFFKGGQYSVYD